MLSSKTFFEVARAENARVQKHWHAGPPNDPATSRSKTDLHAEPKVKAGSLIESSVTISLECAVTVENSCEYGSWQAVETKAAEEAFVRVLNAALPHLGALHVACLLAELVGRLQTIALIHGEPIHEINEQVMNSILVGNTDAATEQENPISPEGE